MKNFDDIYIQTDDIYADQTVAYGGDILLCVKDDISSHLLTQYKTPNSFKGILIEINIRKKEVEIMLLIPYSTLLYNAPLGRCRKPSF